MNIVRHSVHGLWRMDCKPHGIPIFIEWNCARWILLLQSVDTFFQLSPLAAPAGYHNTASDVTNVAPYLSFLVFESPDEVPKRRFSDTNYLIPSSVIALINNMNSDDYKVADYITQCQLQSSLIVITCKRVLSINLVVGNWNITVCIVVQKKVFNADFIV
jgi:hypothetical protein